MTQLESCVWQLQGEAEQVNAPGAQEHLLQPLLQQGQETISQDCWLTGHRVTQDRAGRMLFGVLEKLTQISEEIETFLPGQCHHPTDHKIRPFCLALHIYQGLYLYELI